MSRKREKETLKLMMRKKVKIIITVVIIECSVLFTYYYFLQSILAANIRKFQLKFALKKKVHLFLTCQFQR